MNLEYILNAGKTILLSCGVTIRLFAIVLAVSIPLGFIFTMLAGCKVSPVRWLMKGLIYLLRGTPLMLQLLFVYFGVPNIPGLGQYFLFDRFSAACFAFILNYAAYLAEIYRGGLLAIDQGQYEAAKVLGLTRLQTMTRVIIPQMIRVALPAVGNEAVTLLKDTALGFTIGLVEITHVTKTMVNNSGNPMMYAVAAVVYLVINMLITFAFKKAEQKTSF